MRKVLWLMFVSATLYANSLAYSDLKLEDALRIVKKENLEISIAKFDEKIKELEVKIAKGYSYGKLDLIQTGMRSNDAGNVFGFKLQSREAEFGDFGFDEFLTQMPGWMGGTITDEQLLSTQPDKLNYPDARNHFQTKLSFQLPLYTGGKLTQYEKISKALREMSTLERGKIVSQMIYETKKSFYDISLLNKFIENLTIIKKNIEKLEVMANSMIEEGYAKKVDLLEVQTKKANVVRMLNQANSNKELAYHFLSFLLNHKVNSIANIYEGAPMLNMSEEDMLGRNLDIKKAKKGLEITEMAIDLEKAAFLPEAGIFAEYGSSDNNFLNDFSDHDAYTVGFQIKWNLFHGGIDYQKLEKAKVQKMKAVNQVSLAKKGIALKVAKIKTEIASFEFDIESLKKELELYQVIYENYLGRYGEKLVSINDVIIKQSQQIERVLKLQEVQNRRNERMFELERIANGEKK